MRHRSRRASLVSSDDDRLGAAIGEEGELRCPSPRPSPRKRGEGVSRTPRPARAGRGRGPRSGRVRGGSLSSRSTGRRLRERVRWRGVSPSASAWPISTPARCIVRRRSPCSMRAGDPDRSGGGRKAAQRLDPRRLADPRLRADAVASAASVVAAIPEVRRALARLSTEFCCAPSGIGARRGPRWTGHRHGRVPGGGPKAVHHRQHRNARRAAGSRSCVSRAPPLYTRMSCKILMNATRATADAGQPR